MKKTAKKINLGTILSLVGILFAVVTFICLAGAGAGLSETALGITTTVSDGLAGFLFGSHTIVTTIGDKAASVTTEGLVSYCGIIAFVLTILGLLAGIVTVLKPKAKIVKFVAGGLMILAGILMFMLLVGGTSVMVEGHEAGTFVDFYGKHSLGLGAIFYGIFGILSGLTFVGSAIVRK